MFYIHILITNNNDSVIWRLDLQFKMQYRTLYNLNVIKSQESVQENSHKVEKNSWL